jgi:hypothetical protein
MAECDQTGVLDATRAGFRLLGNYNCDQTGGAGPGLNLKPAESLLSNATKRADKCDLPIGSGRIRVFFVWIT